MITPQTEVIVRRNGVELERRVVEPGEYLIGRGEDCAFQVSGEKISRHHARLFVSSQDWSVADLGSANGTHLNEAPVGAEAVPVGPAQTIRVGDATIELRAVLPGDAEATLLPPQETVPRPLPPELVGPRRYEIGKQVAQGGMGAILDALDVSTRRNVAMKVMLNVTDPGDVLRFIEEAQVTAQLEHPNIVPVHELSVNERGEVFYTMKMVRGITLKKVIELLANGTAEVAKKYPLAALLTIFQKVCDALAFAHSKGVIHRDLKPENIMLGDYGEVLVMDWGLARLVGSTRRATVVSTAKADEGDALRTLTGSIMGTPAYMSPEQARGEIEKLDARSDIYALGTILFELLHLRPVVTGTEAMQIVSKVQRGAVEWQAEKSGGSNRPLPVPGSLLAVCRKALAPAIAERYPRVEDLQADILAYQNGFATSAENAGAWKQFTLFVRRHKAASIGAAAVLLVGSVLGTKAILEGNRAERALGDLKNKAPALLQLADNEAARQQFASALENADTALTLDPAYLPAYWRRAWLLIGMERWNDAIPAIRLAREKDPAHGKLAAILPIIEQLAQAPSDAERWNAGRSEPLLAHLQSVGATGEIVKLSSVLFSNAEGRVRLIRQTLGERLGKDAKFSVQADIQGSISVVLSGLGKTLTTLDAVRGLPIDHLYINKTSVVSLEPLLGMKLRSLEALETNIMDLQPLQGMPLRHLNVSGTKVRDFSPLRGAPLEKLECTRCTLADLSPLRGAPLRWVSMQEVGAADLAFLADSPIVHLHAYVNPIRDITALRGKPLQYLNLQDTKVADLTPLKGTPIEELLLIGAPVGNLSPLLDLPKLRRLKLNVPQSQSPRFPVLRQHPTLELINDIKVAEFWVAYDAKPK